MTKVRTYQIKRPQQERILVEGPYKEKGVARFYAEDGAVFRKVPGSKTDSYHASQGGHIAELASKLARRIGFQFPVAYAAGRATLVEDVEVKPIQHYDLLSKAGKKKVIAVGLFNYFIDRASKRSRSVGTTTHHVVGTGYERGLEGLFNPKADTEDRFLECLEPLAITPGRDVRRLRETEYLLSQMAARRSFPFDGIRSLVVQDLVDQLDLHPSAFIYEGESKKDEVIEALELRAKEIEKIRQGLAEKHPELKERRRLTQSKTARLSLTEVELASL